MARFAFDPGAYTLGIPPSARLGTKGEVGGRARKPSYQLGFPAVLPAEWLAHGLRMGECCAQEQKGRGLDED
jgi:hypothetical protein